MYRQGDVLVIPVTKSTDGYVEVPREGGAVVLAYGEVTGHSHQIRTPGACLLRREGISDRVLTLVTASLLEHEEHDAIELPPGTFTVRIQREYSETEMSRAVVD